MNTRIVSAISIALCTLLASCYPYDEGANRKKTRKPGANKTTATAPASAPANAPIEDKTLKETPQADAANKTSPEEPGSVAPADSASSSIKPTQKPSASTAGGAASTTEKPAAATKKTEYSYASKVPGKEGFVFSPYNNKVVDVRDIPSGTLVQDPTYPAAEKKYFRVP
jgi:hypothetical protein